MIKQYCTYNYSGNFINQLIILISQTISLIYSIIDYITDKKYEEIIIPNLLSFVFFLIPFIIEIRTNNNFTGKKFLKLIPNIFS